MPSFQYWNVKRTLFINDKAIYEEVGLVGADNPHDAKRESLPITLRIESEIREAKDEELEKIFRYNVPLPVIIKQGMTHE